MWRWLFNSMKLMFLVLDLLIERASRGGGSTGSRGAPAPPRPKKNMEPLLNPLHFREEKRRKKERKKKGREMKKKSAPL